jgi:hypothetical protein
MIVTAGRFSGDLLTTDLLQDIWEALNRKTPISFAATTLSSASEAVANALLSAITPIQLESLIVKLAQASGAKAHRLPSSDRTKGDADVLAVHDLRIGNEESIVNVAYQVKQHDVESDEFGIQQLIDRLEARPDIDRACFVTTAPRVSDMAQQLADANDIIVLTRDSLPSTWKWPEVPPALA